MLFSDRVLSVWKEDPEKEARGGYLARYVEGAKIDIHKLNISVLQYIDDKPGLPYKFELVLDEFDLSFSCRINPGGRIKVSLGTLIALDCYSSALGSIIRSKDFITNPNGYDYLRERFPLYADYTFLSMMDKLTIGGVEKSSLAAVFPQLPVNVEAFQLVMLCSNMMLLYIIYHEIAHIKLRHKAFLETTQEYEYNESCSKLVELEADVYAVNRLYQSCLTKDYHRHITHLVPHDSSLYYLVAATIFSAHGLLLSIDGINTKRKENFKVLYPSEACRIVNMMSAIHWATVIGNSLNKFLGEDTYYEVNHMMEAGTMAYVLLNVDKCLREAGRISIILVPHGVELVISPTGDCHGSYVYNNQYSNEEFIKKTKDILISGWLLINHVNDYSKNRTIREGVAEWQKILIETAPVRKVFWDKHFETSIESLSFDPIVIPVARYFIANLDNYEYAKREGFDRNALIEEATSLVESIFGLM